jgi:SAM-dependent methyltransferase
MTSEVRSGRSPADMNYSEFVGLVRERNRPSGGIRTVHHACVQTRLRQGQTALEVGSNTGFTSVNLALLSGARVTGIDLQSQSIAEAQALARSHRVADSVAFLQGDTTHLSFATGSFDLVWASNVPSFVSDKQAMLAELTRVLKLGGSLVAVPIFYRREPPAALVSEVGRAIGTELRVMTKGDWCDYFLSGAGGDVLELYHDADFEYGHRSSTEIASYCEMIMASEHLLDRDEGFRDEVRTRLRYFMDLFNENLAYAGFSVMLFQKRWQAEQAELFLARPALDVHLGKSVQTY